MSVSKNALIACFTLPILYFTVNAALGVECHRQTAATFFVGSMGYRVPEEYSPQFDAKLGDPYCDPNRRIIRISHELFVAKPRANSSLLVGWPADVGGIALSTQTGGTVWPDDKDILSSSEEFQPTRNFRGTRYISRHALIQGAKVVLVYYPRYVSLSARLSDSTVRIDIHHVAEPDALLPVIRDADTVISMLRQGAQ